MRFVDLDDPCALQRAVDELERLHAIRAIDPELRRNIERHLNRLPDEVAAPVRVALDEMHPATVLATFFDVIVPRGQPTIGAVRRRQPRRPTPAAPGPRPPATYRKVLRDMLAAGWPETVAAEAVAGMALEDGVTPDDMHEILRRRGGAA